MREYQVKRYFRSHNIKARMKKKSTTPNKRENQIKNKIGEQFGQQ
jgi:hypothetical protein